MDEASKNKCVSAGRRRKGALAVSFARGFRPSTSAAEWAEAPRHQFAMHEDGRALSEDALSDEYDSTAWAR
eukprot:2213130-Pyramimonas_sp.AAC.1